MIILRSIFFDILFYMVTAVACFICIPFIIFPKAIILKIVRLYVHTVYFLERHIINLDFEIRGLEYLPKQGSYIIAAKHQSAYETLKLHILFDDPSIILKRELVRIPIWGWFLSRLDVIAINRKNREEAMQSIIDGSKRMKNQGRPIIIFPQGTRVKLHVTSEQKPYKGGIIKMYEATELPIIPLALNSGYFWPRGDWITRPGKVVFEFLPPIEPGLPEDKVMKALEERIETASNNLLQEAERQKI